MGVGLVKLRSLLGRSRMVRGIYGRLTASPRGRWLFAQQNLAWLSRPKLRSQLPPALRLFAAYCHLQRRRSLLVGGNLAYRISSAATRVSRRESMVPLRLGPHTAFLLLGDPRSLHVPLELAEERGPALVQTLLLPGDTFVDIGANHGSFSIAATNSLGPAGLIVAIEPQVELAAVVRRALEVNAQCRYEVLQIACGSTQGVVALHRTPETSGLASLFQRHVGPQSYSTDVEVARFDDAVDWRTFPGGVVMKIDIEGGEVDFLQGAKQAIEKLRPVIIIEVASGALRAAGRSAAEVAEVLSGLGYAHFERLSESGPRPLEDLVSVKHGNILLRPLPR